MAAPALYEPLRTSSTALGLRIHPSLGVAPLPYPHCRGVLATAAIAEGAELLTAPRGALLTAAAAGSSPPLRRVFARLGGAPSEDDALALLLLHERARGAASKWETYLAALPASYDLPFAWSDDEVAALEGSGLHALAVRMREQLVTDWGVLAAAVDAAAAAAAEGGVDAAAPAFTSTTAVTLASYTWAMCTVWSRGVSLRLGAEPLGPFTKCLVPFFDMLNTSADARVRHFFDPVRGALVVVTDQGWAAGSQVCLNYGRARTLDTIRVHGFAAPGAWSATAAAAAAAKSEGGEGGVEGGGGVDALPPAPSTLPGEHERYTVEMAFRPGSDASSAATRLELQRLAPPDAGMLASPADAGVISTGEDGAVFASFHLAAGVNNNALLRFLRIQMADPALLGDLGSAIREDADANCSVEHEIDVLRLLGSSFVEMLKALQPSEEGGREAEGKRVMALARDCALGADAMKALGSGDGGTTEDYSLAASDAHERRLQMAAQLKHIERVILESQLLAVEGAMDELRGLVGEFNEREAARKAGAVGGPSATTTAVATSGGDEPPPLE